MSASVDPTASATHSREPRLTSHHAVPASEPATIAKIRMTSGYRSIPGWKRKTTRRLYVIPAAAPAKKPVHESW
jgi:hypothetical protein